MAKLASPSADREENCGEVKNLVSHFQSVKVICLSAAKICGLEILPGAANLDPHMGGTVKKPHVACILNVSSLDLLSTHCLYSSISLAAEIIC